MPSVYIAIPCHNRFEIAEECVRTVAAGQSHKDVLAIYGDGHGHDSGFSTLGDEYHWSEKPIGIEAQRRRHFVDFWNKKDAEYTHLYLTDSDALHDPNWRVKALLLQEEHGGAPVCLYNTLAHSSLIGNTIEDDPQSTVIWRRVAPGISYFLTRAHVEKVVLALPHLPEYWHWDWTTPALLGHRMAISRISYVDHIGLGGMHHPEGAGLDQGDRALSPTTALVAMRAEVVSRLQHAFQLKDQLRLGAS